MFPGDVAYVWHGALHAATVAASLEACGFELRAEIIKDIKIVRTVEGKTVYEG